MPRVALVIKARLIIHAFRCKDVDAWFEMSKARLRTLLILRGFSLFFSVDSFLIKTRFVGLVDRITLEHDNTGILPDWNLDKVPTQINIF